MPPVIFWVLGTVTAMAAGKWLAGEATRINAELYPEPHDIVADCERLGTLRRDPATGIYRPD
jgi:hypothetical protein